MFPGCRFAQPRATGYFPPGKVNLRFQVVPFDVRAATVAAGLWRDYAERNPGLQEKIQAHFPGTERAKIKVDVQIRATALARRAEILYTDDTSLAAIAKT